MDLKSFLVGTGVFLSKLSIYIADLITAPIFTLIDKPWIHWKRKKIIWSKLEDEENPYSCYVKQIHHVQSWRINDVETLDQLFRISAAKHAKKKCFGVRDVFGEEEIKTKSGKTLKKLTLGDYKWITYEESEKRVDDISKGLLALGVQSKKPIVILAETRIEWILTAQACFRINVPVVTLYATLGEDGIAHGINETEVSHVVTSVDLLPKLKKILPKVPHVNHVIYMEGLQDPSLDDIPKEVNVLSFSQMEQSGQQNLGFSFEPPTPDDNAILMYTSGSTGVPKAVMITNKNVIATINGFYDVLGTSVLKSDDKYIAYLPVAHVLELAAEFYMYLLGIPVGFSTPQTFTDFSTAIKPGCKGDLKVLQPTLMAAVPLMLDRIRKSILQLAGGEDSYSRGMFDFAVSYKNYWLHSGYTTPLLDRLVMKTYHDFVGGRMRIVICGGAPISPDTQDFIRCCLNVQVLQGYGMTETAASSTVTDYEDYSVGEVGAPLSNCKLRLVDWDEGQYHVTDRPNPRGEIVVGGDCVTRGYYKNEEKTKECFKKENGIWWFYTGDIAEVRPNGSFKIIDRKNDLVKLQFGEYVALGKIEAELKTCPLVDNTCVIGSGLYTYLIAIVVPNRPNLETLAKELGKGQMPFTDMCTDKEILKAATQRIREHGNKCRLFGSELPQKIKLCTEDWIPDSGLVTAAFKIRRKIIQQHYQEDIDKLYAEHEMNGNVASSAA